MRWAIVIGIDEYGRDGMRLEAAVSDALGFRDWVLAEDGGRVPPTNLRLLLGRRSDDPGRSETDVVPTKDNIVTAIADVVAAAGDRADRLYFYFAGHGITARVANRDESAIVTPGFDELHTDHSLAVRSLTEHFETTPLADQFFFVDACRDVPWDGREFEIGRWPVPRRRDPGATPVQQFILYATSPGRKAHESGWPGEATGAFTRTLMKGLAGTEDAKAWSWERNCYEVRWERLAGFVNRAMTKAAERAGAAGSRVQVPQDAGSRGVAGRDRDALVASFPRGRFPRLALTVELATDATYDAAEVAVLDAVGEPVATAVQVVGAEHTFTLPPKTYAVRATSREPEELFGAVKAPVELYRDARETVELRPRESAGPGGVTERLTAEEIEASGREEPPGTIVIRSSDPLALAEIRDEAGRVAALARPGEECDEAPGFYRVRDVGPEETRDVRFVVLSAGEREEVTLVPPAPPPAVAALASAFGGGADAGGVRPVAGAERSAWALPSTVVAAAVGAALHGGDPAGLGVDLREPLRHAAAGVALFAVAGDGDAASVAGLRVRLWPAGEPVPGEAAALEPSPAGVAGAVRPVHEGEPAASWVSLERGEADATVVSVPVLAGRLATLVAEVDADRVRLYQFHPLLGSHASSAPDRLRRVEHLERVLLGGRLDGAEAPAKELAAAAADDPFAGLVAGYALLRLGHHEELEALASALLTAAPELTDAYVLRGEHEAWRGREDAAAQAFAAAVTAGVPAFGEGLTRLVEGLRTSAFVHPRGALVRHVFQRHVRGSMWSAFTPLRKLEPGRLVIRGADLGYEG